MVQTIVSLASTLILGIIGFFLKNTMVKFEKELDTHSVRINKVNEDLSQFKERMPFDYVLREEFIRSQAQSNEQIAQVNRKLDRIMEILMQGDR